MSWRSLLLAAWLAITAAATFSVVKYDLRIVVVYTAAAIAILLLAARGTGPHVRLPSWLGAATMLGAAAAIEFLPFYSYVSEPARSWLRHGAAAAAVLVAVCWALDRHWARLAGLATAVAAFAASSVAVILLDRAPRIDVWITLQQAADGLLRGENMYNQVWVGSPGIKNAFTYLPYASVLTAPGRWLLGDVRWTLVLACAIAAVATAALGRWRAPGLAAATLLLITPGFQTQVEQAWTEPLLLACLAGWALAVARGRYLLAVVALALGVASKQHLVLLLPVLAAWPAFGWRRTAASGGLAAVLVLPWFIASPTRMWHDTVLLLLNFPPLRFADTLFIAARHQLNWTPPFWLAGLAVLAVIAAAILAVRPNRDRPPVELDGVLRWLAAVLMIGNLVNKQAFYNQYWLVASLLLVSLSAGSARLNAATVRPGRAPEAARSPGQTSAPSQSAPASTGGC